MEPQVHISCTGRTSECNVLSPKVQQGHIPKALTFVPNYMDEHALSFQGITTTERHNTWWHFLALGRKTLTPLWPCHSSSIYD
jgi:hypothetical protein